jgi:hypothetical protein
VSAQNYFVNDMKIVKEIKNIETKNLYDDTELEFNVYDTVDKLIYTVSKNVVYDMPHPGATVFDDGSLVLINSFDASIEFYDNAGSFVKSISLFNDREVTYERSIYFDAVKNLLTVMVSQPEFEQSDIFIINSNAEIVNTWKFETNFSTGIKLSDDLNYAAVSGYTWGDDAIDVTKIYSIEGKTLYSFPFKFRQAKFFGSSFIGITNKTAALVNIENGDLNYKIDSGEDKLFKGFIISEGTVDLLETDKPYLDSGKWIYKSLMLKSINTDGNIVSEKLVINNPFDNLNIIERNGKQQILIDEEIISVN